MLNLGAIVQHASLPVKRKSRISLPRARRDSHEYKRLFSPYIPTGYMEKTGARVYTRARSFFLLEATPCS